MAWVGISARCPPGPLDLVAGVQLANVSAAEAPGTPQGVASRPGVSGAALKVEEGPPRLGTVRRDRKLARQMKEQEGTFPWQTNICRGGPLRRACGPRRRHASHRGR